MHSYISLFFRFFWIWILPAQQDNSGMVLHMNDLNSVYWKSPNAIPFLIARQFLNFIKILKILETLTGSKKFLETSSHWSVKYEFKYWPIGCGFQGGGAWGPHGVPASRHSASGFLRLSHPPTLGKNNGLGSRTKAPMAST